MTKWFKRSLMLLGILNILVIAAAAGELIWEHLEDEFMMLLVAALFCSLLVMFGTAITGIGAAFEFMSSRSGEKAKRGMIYEDAMLNRIMNKLSVEERGYLEGYLNAQSYEPVEGFDYFVDEKRKDNYE